MKDLDKLHLAEILSAEERLLEAIRDIDFSMAIIEPPTLTAEELENYGVERNEAIEFIKHLDNLNAGDYYQGRRGKPTRLEFSLDQYEREELVDEAYLRLKEKKNSASSKPKSKANSKTHTFWLRQNFKIDISLPEDFSISDSKRFKRWLETIPFD